MTDTIPTHTMTTTTMAAVATLSVAACIPATAGEFVPSKSADEHMLTGKTRRLNPAGLSCEECQRQSSLLTFILRESGRAEGDGEVVKCNQALWFYSTGRPNKTPFHPYPGPYP